MAKAHETTFKNLQTDERYKKLERTLKMALLKNGERRSSDNAGTWPNVSSINSDNFDTSLAAMSIQSSRLGSEVVSSSTNLRNILLHKQQFSGPGCKAATSSENQFPTNKNDADCVMMPPPNTPGIQFGRTKRISGENSRVPLLNMPLVSGRNTNGFVMSTPSSTISSIPKCMGNESIISRPVFQENNNYERSAYGEGAPKQERSFSRWRVVLNDKGLLIIKGTLECGKVARSKPVIRRLTTTSVQSIFKHTYHLLGDLVDDRNELPDYVREKFYEGFPDDWENVYEVWRNFVNDGNRLSFRWPTPVTDTDDDIKSGITEITSRPSRYRKPASPRKRNRSAKTSSKLDLSGSNENRPEQRSSSCSHLSPDGTPLEVPVRANNSPLENGQRNNSINNSLKDSCKAAAVLENNQQVHESSVASFNTTSRNSVNSLGGIIPEDKLNIIIDNLTERNCPIEYIDKIVDLFDCMKYVVSYQSSIENGSEKGTPVSHRKAASKTPVNKNRSSEEKVDSADTSSSKNRVNTPRFTETRAAQYGNKEASSNAGFSGNEKAPKNNGRQTRRELTANDYEISESDDDGYDDKRRASRHRYPTSNRRLRDAPKYDIPSDLAASKISREYVEPVKPSDAPHRQYTEPLAIRTQRHDAGDEEFVAERQREQKLPNNRAFLSPRKIRGAGKENRQDPYYDSSNQDVSITEDEERYAEKAETKDMRKNNYSDVSISEEEYRNVRGRSRSSTRTYCTESNARRLQPEIRGVGYSRDNLQKPKHLTYYPGTTSRRVQQSSSKNGDRSDPRKTLESPNRNPKSNSRRVEHATSMGQSIPDDRKRQDFLKLHVEPNSRPVEEFIPGIPRQTARAHRKSPIRTDDDRDFPVASNPALKVYGSTAYNNPIFDNPLNEQQNDPYLSCNTKRSKKLIVNRELAEIESSESYPRSPANPKQYQRGSAITEIHPPKSQTPQIKKKPTVVSVETLQMDVTPYDSLEFHDGKEIVKRAGNSPRKYVDKPKENSPANVLKNDQKNDVDMPEPTNDTMKPTKTRSREDNGFIKVLDSKSSTRENEVKSNEKPMDSGTNVPDAKYGSEANPKLLTAWVPAVKCEELGDNKYHLIFKGKLLNAAGQVTDRKFVTESIRRRLSTTIIETINHDFYKLDGDLNNTKHVVPKELVKLCRLGCPVRIGYFCERWMALGGGINEIALPDRFDNTSVDCLSVPMSSRGRRILPPLHYWAGERVITKDNKTMYSAGTSQESSIPSSLENTSSETRTKKNSPKGRSDSKGTTESKSSDTRKKDVDKIMSPGVSKPNFASPSKVARGSQRARSGKRRLTRNPQPSSSDDDDAHETKPTPRKRKSRVNDHEVANTENSSTRRLRNSAKNTASPKGYEVAHPKKGLLEKSSDPEVKLKLRKRQKLDDNQGTMQQFLTRRPAEVKCRYYKDVPMHDGDLSEDQLSTM